MDDYNLPGKMVKLRKPGESTEGAKMPMASSPYHVHSESAELAASLVEVAVDSSEEFCSPGGLELPSLAPGDELEASDPIGEGFADLVGDVNLRVAMTESWPLLILCSGTKGIGAAKAVLDWPEVQAYASVTPVTCLYSAPSASSAAFVASWDEWRSSGVHFEPVYSSTDDVRAGEAAFSGSVTLSSHLLSLQQGKRFRELVRSDPRDLCALISGVRGQEGAKLVRMLKEDYRVPRERILFCEF